MTAIWKRHTRLSPPKVIELCNGGMDANLTVIALAYIEIELQHHPVRNLSEEKKEIAAYVSKALSFVRKMQKFLATPQVPPLISTNNTTETTASLLQWTGNAIDLVELIYGIDEMGLHQQRQHAAQTACPASLQDIRG